jgi:hypothetical protein
MGKQFCGPKERARSISARALRAFLREEEN